MSTPQPSIRQTIANITPPDETATRAHLSNALQHYISAALARALDGTNSLTPSDLEFLIMSPSAFGGKSDARYTSHSLTKSPEGRVLHAAVILGRILNAERIS